MSSTNEKKFYHPFDPLPENMNENEARYRLVPTSKMHVREVCDVMAKRLSVDDRMRCQYADQAGYELSKAEVEDKVEKQFTLFDVFSEYHVHAALAEALFEGFPQLVQVHETEDGFEVEIVKEELFNRLDEGAVNEAFLSFNAARSGTQGALRGLSSDLESVLSRHRSTDPAALNNSRPSTTTGRN